MANPLEREREKNLNQNQKEIANFLVFFWYLFGGNLFLEPLLEKSNRVDGSVSIVIVQLAKAVAGLVPQNAAPAGLPQGDGSAFIPELVAPECADGQRDEADGEADGGRAQEEILFGLRVGVGLELDQSDDHERDAHDERNDDDVQERELPRLAVAAIVGGHLLGRQRLTHLLARRRQRRRRVDGRGAGRGRRRQRHRTQVARRHDARHGRRRAAHPLPVLN